MIPVALARSDCVKTSPLYVNLQVVYHSIVFSKLLTSGAQ